MATIAIDAGHGGRDPGAVYEERKEKDDVLRLALAVGELLKQNGLDVIYTRTDDVYDPPYQKAFFANDHDADYLVSLHRNAVPVPGSASGIETLVYEDDGIPAKLARSVNEKLAALGFSNRGVFERPNLAVLRRSAMPAILVEVGFIDNESDNAAFDAQFDAIAQAIADGILEVVQPSDALGSSFVSASSKQNDPVQNVAQSPSTQSYSAQMSLEKPSSNAYDSQDAAADPPKKLYRVQVGAFENRTLAYQLNNQLTKEGFPSFLLFDNGLYHVQVGAFSRLENAIRMEYRLRAAGYDTYITT